jgi:hypothetical protein
MSRHAGKLLDQCRDDVSRRAVAGMADIGPGSLKGHLALQLHSPLEMSATGVGLVSPSPE